MKQARTMRAVLVVAVLACKPQLAALLGHVADQSYQDIGAPCRASFGKKSET